MKNVRSSTEQLENVLQGLEEMILVASDKEILADPNARLDSQSAARAISKQLSAFGFSKTESARKPTESSSRSRSVTALQNLDDRIAYLRELISVEPRVPPRMVSVLRGKKKPTDEEVEKVIQDLIRLGFIKSEKK